MYLKSLTLHGFKSFADKTHFEFHQGVTGIVGPNGCGKSNVVDAVRWVLGETSAKALRGDEMADVIFNGTDKRKPVGLAEVVLTMADCEETLGVDFNEVSIGRRVFKDGKGEYRLNGTVCRLKDIHDLFAGTGIGRAAYSIMAQGQIDMLLSSKPEDRRTVFEEAAGITKFKGQKKEALRKLEYTEANLLRVQDIIAEVKRQMGSLQRQAAKARRYQVLLSDTKTLDTHLGHKQFVDLSAEKGETETQVRVLAQQLETMRNQLAEAESEASKTREVYHAVESKISDLRQQAQEIRSQIQSAEGRVGFNQERADELRGRIQQNEEQVNASGGLMDQQRQEIANADEQLKAIQANIETRQTAMNEHAESHRNLVPERQRLEEQRRETREKTRQLEGKIAAFDARTQSLGQQIEGDRRRHETLAKERAEAAKVKEASQTEFDALQRQLAELENNRNQLDEQLKRCVSDIGDHRRQRDELTEELNELQRAVTQRKSRLEVLEQLLQKGEGLAKGTQQVLKGLDNPEVFSTGVRGLLTSSIEVDPEFVPAIEAALQDHLQAVLLTNSELGSQVLDRLSAKQLGRAALMPADLIGLRPAADRQLLPDGAVAWALDKVKVKEGAQDLVDHILGSVLIVPDLPTALRIKKQLPDLALVTLRGEMVSADGVMFGGASKEEGASVLRREAEVRTLRGELESYEGRLKEKEDQVTAVRTQLEQRQKEEAELRESSQKAREALSQMQGKLSVVQRDLQQSKAKLDSVEWDQNQIAERMYNAESQIEEQKKSASDAGEQLEANRVRESEMEVQLESCVRREMESSERLNELRSALALEQNSLQSLERQKAPMAARLNELQSAIQRQRSEIESWNQRIQAGEQEGAKLAQQITEQKQAASRLDEEMATQAQSRTQAFEKVTALEKQLTDLRQQASGVGESRNRAEVQLTRVDLRIENLATQVSDRYSVDLESFEPDTHALLAAIEQQRKARSRLEKRRASLNGEAPASEGNPEAPESSETAAEAEVPETDEVAAGDVQADAVEEVTDQFELDEGQPDWNFVAEVVTELRQKLESIGPVNLDAIQEFEELEERHQFLETQHNDLVKSKDELLEVIAKINETTKTMFSETFSLVRKYFQNNFKELFGKQGKADLLLVDETDPLESGIEIIAKPPGKKLQTISLLSGGERSMTAVALLFSIYQVKPSPFCVLDELDAPLDESNISRFLKMLDNFIDSSQFIIVTHNKRTMSRADVIYGVTMQEFGISKPVGVRMTAEKAGSKQESSELELQAEAEMADEQEATPAEAS
jgi:chromosome segregation protein